MIVANECNGNSSKDHLPNATDTEDQPIGVDALRSGLRTEFGTPVAKSLEAV
jgi:hypothetical protein